MTLLKATDLHVQFKVSSGKKWPWSSPSTVHAVNGVSFDLEKGKTLGIVGESGCGKSTLIRAIAGLETISKGHVALDDKEVNYSSKSEKQVLRNRVQMIFQDPIASLNPRMTIREIVAEPLFYFQKDLDSAARQNEVKKVLDRVGIAERNFNRYPHEFSGGQCQRIGIARALISKPDILLCDEPVSALDVSIQAQVVNLLKELQQDMGLSLIFVAHDLGVVRHISDEILVMYMGGAMEHGPATDLVSNPRHPYTKALLSAVPVPDPRAKMVIQTLDGDLPSPLNLPQGCLFESRCPARFGACQTQRPELKATTQGNVACLLQDA